LTNFEAHALPVGEVLDRIAVWQIVCCGAKEVYRPPGSLAEQMAALSLRP